MQSGSYFSKFVSIEMLHEKEIAKTRKCIERILNNQFILYSKRQEEIVNIYNFYFVLVFFS